MHRYGLDIVFLPLSVGHIRVSSYETVHMCAKTAPLKDFDVMITEVHRQIPDFVQGTLARLLKGHNLRDEAYMMAEMCGFEDILHVAKLHI